MSEAGGESLTSLHLHLPGLAGPGGEGLPGRLAQELLAGLDTPHLAGILACARTERCAVGEGGLVEQQFHLHGATACPTAGWPVAPTTYALDFAAASPGWIYRADPVALEPGLKDVSLHGPQELALGCEEAALLAAALNRHFEPDGVSFAVGAAQRWYLLGEGLPRVRTSPPQVELGGRLDALLPSGAGARQLNRLANEAQMVLHASSVNGARQARGLRPVNGVWIWGGGEATVPLSAGWSAVWSDDPLCQALANAATCAVGTLDSWSSADLTVSGKGEAVWLVEDARGAGYFRSGNLAAWRDWLVELDATVLARAAALLRIKRIRRCRMSLGLERCVVAESPARWRPWRRGLGHLDLFKTSDR